MAYTLWREEKETGKIRGAFSVPSEEQWLAAADVTPEYALVTPPAFRNVPPACWAAARERYTGAEPYDNE